MIDLGAAMAGSAGAIALLMLVTFAISVPLRDVSIVDIAWGVAFTVAAWASFGFGGGEGARPLLMALLTTAWGMRLALFIASRKAKDPAEDPRYAKMREKSSNFVLESLWKIFLLQGVLAWLVSLPLMGAAASDDDTLGPLAIVGIVLWAVGLFFEAVGDWQKSVFKADPANKGKIMDTGLWRYTRHPNYFGDFCVWWGLFALALDGGAWWSVVAPLIMTGLLTKGSGAGMTERAMKDRPGFADYVERTSGFIPLPPKRGRGATAGSG